jgi:hypothetical protein
VRTFHWLVLIGASLLVTVTLAAQQPAGKAPQTAQPTYKPTATIQEIMQMIVSPASKTVFDAVKSEVTEKGVVEKAPKDDKEWGEVRAQAMLMVEASNLLLMPGRRVGDESSSSSTEKKDDFELTPKQVEAVLAKNRTAWNRFARAFNVAAGTALKAATAKNAEALSASGEAVDNACENCHLTFWYPDQDKLLAEAEKNRTAAQKKK